MLEKKIVQKIFKTAAAKKSNDTVACICTADMVAVDAAGEDEYA